MGHPSPVHSHLIPQHPARSSALPGAMERDQAQLEKEDGRCWPLLGTGSSGQGRSWGLSPGAAVVMEGHRGWMQTATMSARSQLSSLPSQLAVILGFHSQHVAVWGGRRGSLSYFYLLAGKEEKPPQPSRAMQQGWEPCSLVSEPGKVIASLAPIPEKPLIYVSANFEALSNLDKL